MSDPLSLAAIVAPRNCNFVLFSKAKRGPKVRWGCTFCGRLSLKAKVCPIDGLREQLRLRDEP
jgi:hypothetical protein